MKTLYKSILDNDDEVVTNIDNRILCDRIDKMMQTNQKDLELIAILEKSVAIYKITDRKQLKSFINNYRNIVGSNRCSLNWIDVSEIRDMNSLFSYSIFNGDISKWNVSKVRDMVGMFFQSDFNSDISKWDVRKVRDMEMMFCHATSFKQDISNWKVNNVVYHDNMFLNCPIKEEYKPKFKI